MKNVSVKRNRINAISRLLTTDETAKILGVKPGTLAYWRCTGRYALIFVRVGRLIMYRPEDIEKFIEERTVTVEGVEG
jgi:predicted site-specific integrase-resolvase